ncbi:MAG TPA: M1 family aminopeptidase [Vicinamibacterales bacterium]|nr:M1 family aminopeptidase [Vicinamibacterales bacterium]
MRPLVLSLLAGCLSAVASIHMSAQAPEAADPQAVYKELRGLTVGGDAYALNGFVLSKDAATFTLTGTAYMLPPVLGKTTGAVFVGTGTMSYTPPVAAERRMLAILTKGEDFNETFERAVFRFTDDTAAQIKAGAAGPAAASTAQAQDALREVNQALRVMLRENLHARILNDVLSPTGGGLFHAYISGRKYSNKLAYMIDPQGVGSVAPEEIQLLSWADNRGGIFSAHHYSGAYRQKQRVAATPGGWIDIQHQKLDTAIDQTGEITGDATMTFVSMVEGLRVVPLSLYPTLRVSAASDAGGGALAVIQEGKDEDADLWIVLPKGLARGEAFTIRTAYMGKEAVSAEGNDNFFPVARANWYPNNTGIKDYATYDMTFSVHKRMRLVATGEFVGEAIDGERYVSRWKSDAPMSVAGFNLGLFKRDEGQVGEYTVVALANTMPSNMIAQLSRQVPIGSYDTASANRLALNEAQVAIQLFNDYFGPISIRRVHMTQQTACSFGQAWPGVIYIPTCYYWNPTLRHQLGFKQTAGGYWDSVASHEVAHLWWGHAVGWNSYRDQWMSEGFSHLSASLFLQAAYPKEPQRFRNFWKSMLDDITQKNSFGYRPIDVGPVTQGYRLNSARTGSITASLIYPKGAYILHMLRMMMWNRDGGDAKFKAMLRDFIATHQNRPVTTEDFKDIVEKHMLPEMNLDGNNAMNWFFNQYVYGTDLPTYKVQQSVAAKDGQTVLSLKLTQAGVSDGFKMLVPLYVEMQDGRVVRLGSATMRGNTTIEQEIPLGQLPVKRALINHNFDVLSLEER